MKNKCKIFKRGRKGITLVALVVTIVVLLILAGVSLNLVLSNNGIVTKAGDAKEEYGKARENEQKDLDSAADYIDETISGIKKIEGVVIPNGYYYVGGTKDTGLVISDAAADENQYKTAEAGKVLKDNLVGNQWVWVPVENMSKYYESVDAGVTISGSTVTTHKYTKLSIEIGTGSNKKTITRDLPGSTSSTSSREPALLGACDSDDNAKKAGFTDANDMATKMVSEYDTMIKSIEKYGGFYIGRYELSGTVNSPTEKSGTTITNQSWYNLYNACKKLGANSDGSDKEGISTRMIWGCQWDATCDFIATKGEQKSITNSSTWGNYKDNTETGKGTNQITGYSESWKANNIYDIAGNCWEWTQEAQSTNYRASRGGDCVNNGSSLPASSRNGKNPDFSYGASYGSRPTLIITTGI